MFCVTICETVLSVVGSTINYYAIIHHRNQRFVIVDHYRLISNILTP